MRRLIALVLLTLLPLQFSWAAVESYCEHEERVEAAQLAEPAQHAVSADAAAAVSDAGTSSDAHCDSCHCHGHCTGILRSVRGVVPLASGARPTAALADTGGAPAPARPERPQWAPLA